ncbi:MAG: D-alanyl-D-alanine carboxypeptidase/D-alanyl-D-alanine endopeptidase [Acidimicrobiales bacterium]
MQFGRLLKQWLPPALLAIIALVAWQSANRADFDPISAQDEQYELTLETPLLSARRAPRTLRAPVSDARITADVNRIIEESPSQQVCVMVRNGDRLLGMQSEVAGGLVPASNQKLLTTYAALGILGPDFTFSTRAAGTVPVVDGVLAGDLYLVGGGDPFLITDNWLDQYEEIDGRSHTRLEELADALVATGLTSITGAVIGDESRYDSVRYGPWDGRLITQKQSGPMSALTVNEGFVDWPDTFRDSFRPRQETDDPPVHAASVFTQLLRERDITIGGGVSAGVKPPGAIELASVQSPPLLDTITHINSYSSNIGAELLLKGLGLAVLGQGTTEAGAAAVTTHLTDEGIPMQDVQVFDGSGLAESDRLTCAALAAILVRNGPESPLGSSLSIAGQRGSLQTRFVDTPADELVLAKTGTLRGVRALSGYVNTAVETDPGAYVTFAYILNDDDVIEDDAVRAIQDPFISALTRYPGGPAIALLSPRPPVPVTETVTETVTG